jgi:hypothetical protein
MKFLKVLAVMAIGVFALGSATSYAKDVEHRIVFQVSSGDPVTQNLVLNNVANVTKGLGPGNVTVEVVAYGPGLSILTAKNKKAAARVQGMAMNDDITFSACHNTMLAIKKKTGHEPKLTKGVKIVPGGVVRIMHLQEQGYTYIRP